VHALARARPARLRRELYLTTRAVFVTGTWQVATFDRVFCDVFGSIGPAGAEDAVVARG
jgi:hypothetical protein